MEMQRDEHGGGAAGRPSPRMMKAMLEQAARQWEALAGGDDANPIGEGDVVAAIVARGWSAEFHHKGLSLASEPGGSAWHVVGAHRGKVVALRAGGED